jgi:hypothetical protein
MENQTRKVEGDIKGAVTDSREKVADFVEGMGDRIESSMPFGEEGPREFGRRAKSALNSTADYIRQTDFKHVVDDVTRFTKSNPVAMLLGAVAVGFVAGRMMRHS